MVTSEFADGVATLTIDDPARRNALGLDTIRALLEGLQQAIDDPDVGVIVITGAGDEAFSAGGDLTSGLLDAGTDAAHGAFADVLRLMWRGGKPTVARVNGHAMAGGFGLATACDITICVDDAKLGLPEVRVGLWPMMVTVALLRAMPQKAALELMLTGRTITPDEALRLGAVSRVVTRGDLDAAVAETAASLRRAPAAVQLGRDAFMSVSSVDLDTALDRLEAGFAAVLATSDAREGIAAFVERRKARFTGE